MAQINKIRIGGQLYDLNDEDLQQKLTQQVERATQAESSLTTLIGNLISVDNDGNAVIHVS